MNLDELEAQYRYAIDDVLNQMQTVVLLLAQVETRTIQIGNSIQGIRDMMESFIAAQRAEASSAAALLGEKQTAYGVSELEHQEMMTKLQAQPSPLSQLDL
jgi:membrane protein required for beta-lactamase induction